MALTQTQISELYVSIFNRASEKSGSQNWLNSGFNTDATAMANAMLDTGAAKEYFGTSLDSNVAFVEHIYANTLNKAGADVDAAGKAGWVEFLETGASRGEMVAKMIEAIKEYQVGGSKYATADQATRDAAKQFANRVEVSDYTADTLETIAVSEIDSTLSFGGALTVTADPATITTAKKAVAKAAQKEGSTLFLTEGRDNVIGTADNDTIYAFAGQNKDGAISNAFSTGDFIDGGAGTDTLMATIINDQKVDNGAALNINGRTTNLEIAKFEVLEKDVIVDAGAMDSVEQFWSNNSDATLVINDVRLGSKLGITKDITFGLNDVDQKAGLIAAFESQSLKKSDDSKVNSLLEIKVADVSTETPATPVKNVDITIGFTLDGVAYVLENIRSEDGSYAGLKAAIEAKLVEKGLSALKVDFGTSYNSVTAANNTVNLDFTAQSILIKDPAGKAFTNTTFEYKQIDSIADQFLVVGNATPGNPANISNQIETNLILDNAGRASTAGDVVIGGMSNSNKVIDIMNLTVVDSSKIAELSTAYGMESGDAGVVTKGTQKAFKTIIVDSSKLTTDGYTAKNEGNLTIGNIGNTETFDATKFTGKELSVTAGNTFTDGGTDTDGQLVEGKSYVYNTGASNDTVTVNYTEPKNLVDTKISINTGAGDDTILVTVGNMGANDYANSVNYSKFTINAGEGNDTITTKGNGNWIIEAGAGNDTVYADNTGAKAKWLVGTNTKTGGDIDINDLKALTTPFGKKFLVDGKLTVVFTDIVGTQNADAKTVGHEVTVDIKTDANYTVTQKHVNDAIKKAINEDAVLSKLLKVEDAEGNVLVITSLIDGKVVANQLEITVAAPAYSTYTAAQQTAITNAYKAFMSSPTMTDALAVTGATNAMGVAAGSSIAGIQGINGIGAGDAYLATDAIHTQTIAFGGTATAAGTFNILVDGAIVTVVTIAGTENATQMGDLAVTALNAAGYNATNAAGTVTIHLDATTVATQNVVTTTGAATGATLTPTSTASTVKTVVDITGTNSISPNGSDNTITGGAGDDVIVLGTGANSNDTVVFEGNFGNDTILNFTAAAGANMDKLDFNAYLTSQETLGSTVVQNIAKTVTTVTTGAIGTIEANEVNVVNGLLTKAQFDALTGSSLLADLNESTALGTTTLFTATAFTKAGLVGTTHKSLIMIENAGNLGEYKVFELVSNNTSPTTDDFVSATLVGTVDFGETQTILVGNLA